MATIEIPDHWLESTGLSVEEARDYLLSYPVMAEICLFHMTSTMIRTPPNSIIGHARVMLNGIEEPVTERQSEDLRLIIHSAERLFEHLTHFINMVSSVFKRHKVYLNKIGVKETVTSAVISATKQCKYEIRYNIPDSTLVIQTDQILFERLLSGMLEITKHICPTYEGIISISVEQIETSVKIGISTAQDTKYPLELSSHNPFVFMAQSFARELKGDFAIFQKENLWQIAVSLPIIYE
jgi:hypothetical protein